MAKATHNRIDPTHIDPTDLDLSAVARTMASTTSVVAQRAARLAVDATYVTVGFGILGLQRAQALRRHIERSLPG